VERGDGIVAEADAVGEFEQAVDEAAGVDCR
jgi:hypothetical protein